MGAGLTGGILLFSSRGRGWGWDFAFRADSSFFCLLNSDNIVLSVAASVLFFFCTCANWSESVNVSPSLNTLFPGARLTNDAALKPFGTSGPLEGTGGFSRCIDKAASENGTG